MLLVDPIISSSNRYVVGEATGCSDDSIVESETVLAEVGSKVDSLGLEEGAIDKSVSTMDGSMLGLVGSSVVGAYDGSACSVGKLVGVTEG